MHIIIVGGGLCGGRYNLSDGAGDGESLSGRLSSVRSFRHDGRQTTGALLRCARRHFLRSLQRHTILRVRDRGLGTARHFDVAHQELLLQGIVHTIVNIKKEKHKAH